METPNVYCFVFRMKKNKKNKRFLIIKNNNVANEFLKKESSGTRQRGI